MSEAAEITVAELEEAVTRLLVAARDRFGARLELNADEYWSVWPSEAFEVDTQPRLLRGSLLDDVNSVRELLLRDDRTDDQALLWHDLNHLVGVLQRISALSGA